MLIAHRGLVKNGLKENTIPAFLAAINDSTYNGFEFDVYTSRDGEFVVYHDPLISGRFIWNCDYAFLKKKGIVKLEEVLKLKTDKIKLIEIKDISIDTLKFIKLLKKYKKQNLYVMSFFTSVIKKFKNVPFKVGVLNYILNSSNDYSFDFIGILYDVASFHMIDALRKANIEFILYALNKKDPYIYKDVYYIVDAY